MKTLRLLSVIMFVQFLSSKSAYAQDVITNIQDPIIQLRQNSQSSMADLVKPVSNLKPREFVEIQLTSKDGSPVPMDKMIILYDTSTQKPEQGVKIKVSEYLKEINDLERNLNKMGRSLRDEADFGLLTQIPTDTDALGVQSTIMGKSIRQFDPNNMKELLSPDQLNQTIGKLQSEGQQMGLGTLRDLAEKSDLPKLDIPPEIESMAINVIKPLSIPEFKADKVRQWNTSAGDPNTLKAFANAELKLAGFAGKAKSSRGQASGNFGGHVFGSGALYLGQGYAEYHAPETGEQEATVRVEILGREILRLHKKTNNLSWGDQFSKSVGFEKHFPFAVGPIPCDAMIGAKGSTFLNWKLGLAPLAAYGSATVGAQADAYASVVATVGVAEIGARGNVLLIKDTVTLQGNAEVGMRDEIPFVKVDINAINDLEALSGRIYAYAAVMSGVECEWDRYYLKCGVHKNTFEQDLFSWSGLKKNGNILNLRYKLSPLGSEFSGDVRVDDIAETQELAAKSVNLSLEQQENWLNEGKNKISMAEYKFFNELKDDLQGQANNSANGGLIAVNTQSQQLESNIKQYLQELGQ